MAMETAMHMPRLASPTGLTTQGGLSTSSTTEATKTFATAAIAIETTGTGVGLSNFARESLMGKRIRPSRPTPSATSA